MKLIFKKYLFNKNIFVSDSEIEHDRFEVLFGLANVFGIKIVEGSHLVSFEMLSIASDVIGVNIPEPFYKGFPESVKKMSSNDLLFDQLLNYFLTYDIGDFSKARHSLFEEDFQRLAFKENYEIKEFKVIKENEAFAILKEIVDNLMLSTRALNDAHYELVKEFILTYKYDCSNCKSKNTIIKLLTDTKCLHIANSLSLSDFIKVVSQINYYKYGNREINNLNLKNQDRKFLTLLLNYMLSNCHFNVEECFEKRKAWNGVLHHIHYKTDNVLHNEFINLIRGKVQLSTYSAFEDKMSKHDIKAAVDDLYSKKGSSMILRKLNYIISRCRNKEDISYVLEHIKTKNSLLLIQLILSYQNYKNAPRTFTYTYQNKLVVYKETEEEYAKSKSKLSKPKLKKMCDSLVENLADNLKNTLGKVYIDKDMKNIALPISESTTSEGYKVLPKGSKIKLEKGEKIRGFIYWDHVNDIDLSITCLRSDGTSEEFSWRSMFGKIDESIVYSGDEVSGYKGGSEYFDIDVALFRKLHPKARYLIFNANVFSNENFCDVNCKAGYMIRDVEDSGEIFEPKTVKSSFKVSADSIYAHLFAIDLDKKEFVWLNIAKNSTARIAFLEDISYLVKYINMTKYLNLHNFFSMLATKVVKDPSEADVIVSDKKIKIAHKAKVITSNDTEKIMALLNK